VEQLQHEAAEATEIMRQLTCTLFKLKGLRDEGLRFRLRFKLRFKLRFRVSDRDDEPVLYEYVCIYTFCVGSVCTQSCA
jgi:hypothetical protein